MFDSNAKARRGPVNPIVIILLPILIEMSDHHRGDISNPP